MVRGSFYMSAKASHRPENYHVIDFEALDVSKFGGTTIRLNTRWIAKQK